MIVPFVLVLRAGCTAVLSVKAALAFDLVAVHIPGPAVLAPDGLTALAFEARLALGLLAIHIACSAVIAPDSLTGVAFGARCACSGTERLSRGAARCQHENQSKGY